MFISDGRQQVGDPDLRSFEPETTGTSFDGGSYDESRMGRKLERKAQEQRDQLVAVIREANADNIKETKDRLDMHHKGISELFKRTETLKQHVQRLENGQSRGPTTGNRTR